MTVLNGTDKGDCRIQKALLELDGKVNYLQGSLGDLVAQLVSVRTEVGELKNETSDVHIVQSPMADQIETITGKVRDMCYTVQNLMRVLEV